MGEQKLVLFAGGLRGDTVVETKATLKWTEQE